MFLSKEALLFFILTAILESKIVCILLVWVAHKHIKNPRQKEGMPTPHVLVTVLVDQISFTDIIPKVSKLFIISHHQRFNLHLKFDSSPIVTSASLATCPGWDAPRSRSPFGWSRSSLAPGKD